MTHTTNHKIKEDARFDFQDTYFHLYVIELLFTTIRSYNNCFVADLG